MRYLVGQVGVRQFLDIGTGIPAADNTHEAAQAMARECRVVYVDNDPIVLSHARALLTSETKGATAYLDEDLRNVAELIRAAAGTLDFAEPVAVMLIGILQCIPDEDDPAGIIKRLMDAVPSGSYLAISHPASDIDVVGIRNLAYQLHELMPMELRFRSGRRSPRCSTGWSWWSPAWSGYRNGGPTRTRIPPTRRPSGAG